MAIALPSPPRHTSLARLAMLALIVVLASEARAQTTPALDWQHGTTLAGFVGAASAPSQTDAAVGLSLGWEITPRFGIEGRAIWIGAGDPADAFSATLATRVPLRPGRRLVPFAAAGLGLHRARFDATATDIPDFYRSRLTSSALRHQTFTDFAVSLGGGIDVYLTRHLALQPEVTVLLATTRSDARAVTVYGAKLAYHFENHPTTPQRHR